MNKQQTEYINDVALQVELALTASDTPDAVKDCLKTIIFEAANEAGLPLADFALVRAALPNIINNLDEDYGRGFLRSIAAIIRQETKAFEKFYGQRLDEGIKPFDHDEIITQPEVEKLIDSLLTDAEYHSYAVYGLMFLFGSIKKLIDGGSAVMFGDIYFSAMVRLYACSENIETAIVKTVENIHLPYRAADFTGDDQREINAAFVAAEFGELKEKNDGK